MMLERTCHPICTPLHPSTNLVLVVLLQDLVAQHDDGEHQTHQRRQEYPAQGLQGYTLVEEK